MIEGLLVRRSRSKMVEEGSNIVVCEGEGGLPVAKGHRIGITGKDV
jgi:hypothetical protein